VTSRLLIFTLIHTALSLIGIASGFVVVLGLLAAKPLHGWTGLFLATTLATSVTGFFFPFHGFTPAHGVGIVSVLVLVLASYARYGRHFAGAWRRAYAITAVIALYFNVFVLIVQAFMKVPALQAMAPTQSEPPFIIAQFACLVLFVVLGILAAIRFRGDQFRKA
jgi:hypothetical protein